MNANDGELPLYHVHGFLPQKGKLDSNNSITLGESTYHSQYLNTYSWNNLIQLNKFIDKCCLFIGSSLTDPNIRRLLDIAIKQSSTNSAKHYIIKRKHNKDTIEAKIQSILKKDKELSNSKVSAELGLNKTSELLIEIVEKFEENDLLSLGVNTIWVNDFNEIPSILKQIREKI